MELMSSLLLCALVAFLPQALGQSRRKFSYDNGYNDSVIIRRKVSSMGKNIILNKNPQHPSLHNRISDLQSIFMDPACRGCFPCMERAMSAHKSHIYMMDPRISSDQNFQDDRSNNMIDVNRRDKRKATTDSPSGKKYKRPKSKKIKGVTLMKYNENGKIYALKIKETNSVLDLHNKSKLETTCHVYSVQKSFSCESPEANLVLTNLRRKTNKKSKKGHGKRETKKVEPIKAVIAPVYRKSNIDDSYVLEQVLPSIEEMY